MGNDGKQNHETSFKYHAGRRTRLLAGPGTVTLALLALLLEVSRLRGDLRLDLSRFGTNVLLTWTNAAVLESAITVTGLWSTVTGADALLSWSTNSGGFRVEYRPGLDATNWLRLWKPVVVSGDQYTVTEAATDPQRFYHLVAP